MASVIFTTSVIGTRRPATLTNGTSSSSSSSSDVSSSTPKKDYCKKKIMIQFQYFKQYNSLSNINSFFFLYIDNLL